MGSIMSDNPQGYIEDSRYSNSQLMPDEDSNRYYSMYQRMKGDENQKELMSIEEKDIESSQASFDKSNGSDDYDDSSAEASEEAAEDRGDAAQRYKSNMDS